MGLAAIRADTKSAAAAAVAGVHPVLGSEAVKYQLLYEGDHAMLGIKAALHSILDTIHNNKSRCIGNLTGMVMLAGQDSYQQQRQQLYSLLRSMLKFKGDLLPHEQPGPTIMDRITLAVAHAAVALLPPDDSPAPAAAAAAAAAAMHNGPIPMEPSLLPAAAGPVHSSSVQQSLPSLTLLGHCCLQWAAEFEAYMEMCYSLRKEDVMLGTTMQELSATDVALNSKPGQPTELQRLAGGVLWWLQGGTVSAELEAAGGKAYHLQQRLRDVIAAVDELFDKLSYVVDGVRGVRVPTPAQARYPGDDGCDLSLLDEWRGLGHALSIFAVPTFCNNPFCNSVSGPTELGRMLGRSCMCGGCKIAHYCSRGCQPQHRREHKWVCKKLAAAAALAIMT